jgi:hypothetical protein
MLLFTSIYHTYFIPTNVTYFEYIFLFLSDRYEKPIKIYYINQYKISIINECEE